MADWVVGTCQQGSGHRLSVTKNQGSAILQLYNWVAEGSHHIEIIEVGNGDAVRFKVPSMSTPAREENEFVGGPLPFTNVEGEPLGQNKCMLLGRCSRTFTVIWGIDSLCCVSCGRHASKSSFEYSWLTPDASTTSTCGVCGCLCLGESKLF